MNRHVRAVVAVLAFTAAIALLDTVDAAETEYSVLLIGNSHSSRGNLPEVLQQLLEIDVGSSVHVKAAGHWAFLAERLEDNKTQELLESRPWTHVVLQAQKYSTSGQYVYPTEAAEEWIRRSRNVGAQPILFLEWARLENEEEGARIHRLHVEIASREPACVAPIGLAWEISLEADPEIRLHHRDGNHANRAGALLTAYVLYGAITGNPVMDLPEVKVRGVSGDTQAHLRAAAALAAKIVSPCSEFHPEN